MSNIGKISLYRPKKQNSVNLIERRKGDRRAASKKMDFPASLMAHIIVDHQRLIDEPSFSRQPINAPLNIYKNTAKAQINRMPAGYAQENIV